MRKDNLPNLIAITRLIIAPITLWLILQNQYQYFIFCLFLMILAEFSDFLDGFVARKYNATSDVGKLLDPLCDSLYRDMVFFGFVGLGWMNVWMIAIIVSRDIIVAYLRTFAVLQNIVFFAKFSGKLKAVAQGAAQFLIVFTAILSENFSSLSPQQVSFWLLLIATIVTAYSALDYIVRFLSEFRLRNSKAGNN